MIFSIYISTLLKRIFFIFLLCGFYPLLLFAYNYPASEILSKTTLFFTLIMPWIFWFHQVYFSSVGFRFQCAQNIGITLTSCFINSLLIILWITLFTPSVPSIEKQARHPNNNMLITEKGSLILDISKELNPLFSLPNTKAIWISEVNILFSESKTNSVLYELSDPVIFQNNEYTYSEGSVTFGKPQGLYYNLDSGNNIINRWINTIQLMYFQLTQILSTASSARIPLHHLEKTPLVAQNLTKQLDLQIGWFAKFISIFNLLLLGSTLGIAISLVPNVLTTLALLGIIAFQAPRLFLLAMIPINKFSLSIVSYLAISVILMSICTLLIFTKYKHNRGSL